MLRDPERAMDATQEVLITLLTRLHTLRDPKAFWGWLLQIVANRCRNELSRAPREEQIPENEQGDSMLESVAELNSQMVPEQALDQAETQQMIRTLVEELPPSQKMCVLLYYYDELPVRQIAAILQVSENTVKSRLSYARKSIQSGVEDYEKQGVKLYSAAPLPLLLAFLRHEGAASALPAAQAKALAATVVSAASGTAAAAGAAGTAAGAAAGASGAGAAAAAGAATGVAAKVAAGILAAAVAVGGITVAVRHREPHTAAPVAEEEQTENALETPSSPDAQVPEVSEPQDPEPQTVPDRESEKRNLTLLRESYDQQFPLNLPVYVTDITRDGMDDVLVVDDTQWDAPTTVYLLTVEDGQPVSYPLGTLPDSGSFGFFVREDIQSGETVCFSYVSPDQTSDGSSRFDQISFADGEVLVTPALGVGGTFSALTDEEWKRFDLEAAELLADAVPMRVYFDPRVQGLDCTQYGISDPDLYAISQLQYPLVTEQDRFGFTVSMPETWQGKYQVVREVQYGTGEQRSTYFCTSNRVDGLPEMGELFSVCFLNGVTPEDMAEKGTGSELYLGTRDGLYVYVQWPTDYRGNSADPALEAEFQKMNQAVPYVVSHILLDQ